MKNQWLLGIVVLVSAACVSSADAAKKLASAKLTSAETARQVDQALQKERVDLQAPGGATKRLAAKIDDEGFIRRVTLDLIGQIPTPEDVTLFVLDPADGKRARLVERLLADEKYGRNWARYWRDVILYRATEPRALIFSAGALEKYLTEEFNQGASWRDIAKSFITATGDVREKGQTALIMAQGGKAEETTAEISRIFMGVQIQCAQCHDHPTDRWKRRQFHEMAAFFPRIALRPKRNGAMRSFEVVSFNNSNRRFRRRRGQLEHYMPDLEKPAEKGTLITPKFFVTNRAFETGKTDLERRNRLANWLTGYTNPWFTRAIVNRMWSELVGEGFYEPVDDMGPDRESSSLKTLSLLAGQFMHNHYDVKWLLATIIATDAYQRESRARRGFDEAPFSANCSQRLRGDQLFTAITQVLEIPEQAARGGRGGGLYRGGGLRRQFNLTFGFDPSTPREEIAGSIPQALFMMNSRVIHNALDARRTTTVLGRLLKEIRNDEELVAELYLRCLAREPKPSELKTCLEHVKETGDRKEAFEDLLWALLNSTEFLHRK